MTQCQHCHRQTQLYLCDDCRDQLANMLDELPWLIDELDARIQQLDRTTHGTIGRHSRDPAELNPIDFDAAETARNVRTTLTKWVNTIAERHTGRRPAHLQTTSTQDLARWLRANLSAITRMDLAHRGRHPLYDDINELVGTTQDGGELVQAINRQDRTYYGPCTQVIGKHRDGTLRICGHDLYGPAESTHVQCRNPRCKTTVDARKQLMSTINRRDLVTEDKLWEALDNLNEHVPWRTLHKWIRSGQLETRGYVHAGRVVPHRIRRGDPRVFSISQARQLRRKHQPQEQNA